VSVRLRGRFTLWFTLAALIPIAAAAFATREVVSQSYRQQFERVKASAEDVARREIAARGAAVERAAAALADRDHDYVGALLLELQKGEEALPLFVLRRARDRAAPIMRGLGLDVLLLIGDEAVVLAAPHNRPAQDELDPRGEGEVTGEAYFALEPIWRDDRLEEVLTIQAAGRVRDGERGLTVIAGTIVGDEILAPARQLDRVDARLVAPGGAIGQGGAIRVPLPGPHGAPVAWIEAEVSDEALREVLAEVTRNTALLGLGALVFTTLLGLLVSRRISRDLDELHRGAEAASRGDLDHRVSVRARDEIGEVAAAFNAMMLELRDSKARLAMAERIAAWRDIAQRLAHEIKNPLTPIQMSIETLRRAKEKAHPSFDEVFDESTRTVLEESARLKRIVGELSELAQLPRAVLEPCDLNEVARKALALYRGAAAIEGELAESLPEIFADSDQLVQVLVNLLENARDASGEGGRIRVATRATSAGGAELVVDDDGPGVDPAVRERLFEPYVTTKKESGGTGLGLAIADRIVADHGGAIEVEDAPGGGARFRVLLPPKKRTRTDTEPIR
jgi:two-component system, NtrC family, nitrogen regulation sensor histidine kinase NtrY